MGSWPIVHHVDQSMCGRRFGNCRGSIFCNTAGLTYFSTICSSASLDKIGVREMGRIELSCYLVDSLGN